MHVNPVLQHLCTITRVRDRRVDAARAAASRQRVTAKHSKHRNESAKLKQADALIKKQQRKIVSLESSLTHAEKAANFADGDTGNKHDKGKKQDTGKKRAYKTPTVGNGAWFGAGGKVTSPPQGFAKSSKLYHIMGAPGSRNVANHRDAIQYNYAHHDASWDGNRVPTEGRGDRKDRQARNARYPDSDGPSAPGGFNFVYGRDETYAPQDYGSYYGPQAYYDGYYRGGDGSTERATRQGSGEEGRGRLGRGRHVYAYASPYDRSEEFRQHENYVNMLYHYYTTTTNENQQQSISDAQKWQYNAAQQQYDAYLRDEATDRRSER